MAFTADKGRQGAAGGSARATRLRTPCGLMMMILLI